MNRKEEICDKALELFIADGYDQTPLSRIARALVLTKAGLYHYFSSKEELLYFIHERHLKKPFEPILDAAEKITDPGERIIFFIRSYTKEAMVQDPAAKVLVHEIQNLEPQHRERILAVWKRALDILRGAIAEMEAEGKIKEVNRTFAAFAAIGMCSWTFYWFDYNRKESAEDLADTYVRIFLKGLCGN